MIDKVLSLAAAVAVISGVSGAVATAEEAKTAIFAGGCFWCVEADFDKVDGVSATVSGYTGGTTENPTYKQVTYGDTGHYEAVRVTYDPAKVDYATLVDYFLRHIDPTDAGGQFCDRGDSYRTAIFVDGAEERRIAEAAIAAADAALEDPVVTPVIDASTFTPAEDYHQDYYLKSPTRYEYYRWGCGRDARIDEVWGSAADKPS